MNQQELGKAIHFIRPKAEFALCEMEILWHDEQQTKPSQEEIEAGWVAYQAAQVAEAETKATQKAALLDRLGITEDEAKLLLS